jgi:hypothetical protein
MSSSQLSAISPAITHLLAKSIDFAGVFAPANLSLSETLAMFNRYLHGRESWIVGSIVLPVNLLGDVTSLLDGTPFRLTAIPRRAEEPELWLSRLEEDCEHLQRFLGDNPQVAVQALEILLPSTSQANEIENLLEKLVPLVDGHRVFLELPMGDDSLFQGRLRATIGALEHHGLANWGLKLRMGGPTPSAVPSVSLVADVIATVRDHRIPIKFTSGLHHPLRHWDNDLGVATHGFINVLMAALFAYACRLPSKNIEAILSDERSKDFVFNGNVARWLDLPLRTELIEDLRRQVVSFGSCSLDEPLHDLRMLDWVD